MPLPGIKTEPAGECAMLRRADDKDQPTRTGMVQNLINCRRMGVTERDLRMV